MVFDYYFSRPPTGQLHFYNYYRDQQPHYENDREDNQYDIVLQLPNLGGESISDNPWLTFNSSSKPNELIVNSKIWNFQIAETFRINVRDAYLDFLSRLEGNEITPDKIQLIKTRLAEVIPMTFDELLFYHYGFNQVQGYIDLQAGMRLRVDYQNYQFVAPSDQTASNGFVGSGGSFYQLHSYINPANAGAEYRLGFNGFLARVQLLVNNNTTNYAEGVSGMVDLLDPTYRRPYYRLFYPNQLSNTAGHNGAERAVVLIGADTLTEMKTATDNYLNNNGELPNTDGAIGFYFRGRATVIPEISIFVNEQPIQVPVGTTVRQLMEQYDNIPTDLSGHKPVRLQGAFRPRRLIHQGANNFPSYQFINYKEIQQRSDGLDEFDLPLVKGDRFYF